MAPAAKKLRALSNSSAPSGQQGIAAFAKASKPMPQSNGILSQKQLHIKKTDADVHQTIPTSDRSFKKRKHDETDAAPAAIKNCASASLFQTRETAQLKSVIKSTSVKDFSGIMFPIPACSDSPSSSTASNFDLCNTRASSPASHASIYFGITGENETLKIELADLRELYNAFLNAFSLHYAHNGSCAPVDFNQLKPSVERIWGKRGIQISDIQRVLGVAVSEYVSTTDKETEAIEFPCYGVNEADAVVPVKISITEPKYSLKLAASSKFPFSLSDHGNGKVCVELSDPLLNSNLHSYPINITTLMQKFDKVINRYKSSGIPFAHLPLAAITPCTSLKYVSASQSRTRTLIADIKAGAAHARANNDRNINSSLMPPPKPPLTVAATTSPSDPMNRSNALIARILAKKSIADQKPAPPSTETLSRRAAFQRLDEIVGVLDSLATIQMRKVPRVPFHKRPRGDQTYSFTIPMLVQSLQGSMRSPIAKAEVIACMGLLAERGIGKGYVALNDVTTGHKIGGDVGKIVVVKGGVGGLRGKMHDAL